MAAPVSRDFTSEISDSVAQRPEVVRPLQEAPNARASVHFQNVFADADSNEEEDQPERYMMDTMAMRPRSMSHHLSSVKVPSRAWLHVKARFWRSLMSFGMTFHDFPSPRAPKQDFVRKIATDTIPIEMYFYLPKDYHQRVQANPTHRYPIVVNFHGGGFCLGHPTDDRYWARVVLAETPAVFVSVGYRRAPEHPFPQPVDDCVEALLYLQAHADELHLDPSQTALSGFSAGGNLVFTVPFRLTYQYEKQSSRVDLSEIERVNSDNFVPEPETPDEPAKKNGLDTITSGETYKDNPSKTNGLMGSNNASKTSLKNPFGDHANTSKTNLLDLPGPRSKMLRSMTQHSQIPQYKAGGSTSEVNSLAEEAVPRLRIVSLVAWYPLLDWTSSRAAKKRHSRMPKKTLPAVFTDLFDFSYLPAPDHEGHHCSPYASPCLAPDHMISDGLPNRIQMWLCEWDMLLAEGEHFAAKLERTGKNVQTELISAVPHGFDKSPNPFRDQKRIDSLYSKAAAHLRDVFQLADRRATVGEGIGLGGIR